jgi:hypothetical protein
MKLDPYFDAALTEAFRLQSQDNAFALPDLQDFDQGKNNRVLRCTYAGKASVFKYYADGYRENIPAKTRWRREVFCLTHFADSGLVPRIHRVVADSVIVMEDFGHDTIASVFAHNSEFSWSESLQTIYFELGRAHAKLVNVQMPANAVAEFANELSADAIVSARYERLISAAREICAAIPQFTSWAGWSLKLLRAEEEAVSGRVLVYKFDQNPANVILCDGRIRGLIDFEQSFIGTELIFLGATFDALNFQAWDNLSPQCWDAFKSGYEAQSSSTMPTRCFKTIVAMAVFNHWLRIRNETTALDRRIEELRASPRLENYRKRFERYQKLIAL